MERRTFLKRGLEVSAGIVFVGSHRAGITAAEGAAPQWRTFEVTTSLEILNASGVTRAWLPIPLMFDTDYFQRKGNRWTGNAGIVKEVRYDDYGTGLLYAEWSASEKAPSIQLSSLFATRNRRVDLGKPGAAHIPESEQVIKHYLQPTDLIPTDGIVAETSHGITKGFDRDLDKARAIYDWVVESTYRDPKVLGCGLGDIRTMLKTRYFGGKCADINALFVGLARSAGLPARDLYGIRCAPSAEFSCLGKGGDITKAQHCRAEVYLADYGWVPLDPADVRKVILEEKPAPLALQDPIVSTVRALLFGSWEMNYLPYNFAHDVKLPKSPGKPVPFLMYPQAETADERLDSLGPQTFRYSITSAEIKA